MAGFNQSYTYFTWRVTKHELEHYITELATVTNHYFRPNFWPNTPDILPPHLTGEGENAHLIRLLLAATLSSSYGIYGPVFEYGLNVPLPGKEEYIDNEKYELQNWDWSRYSKIREVITIINQVRKENDAFQRTDNISILNSSNEKIMSYAKKSTASGNTIITAINLDQYQVHEAVIDIPHALVNSDRFIVRDLLGGDIYKWKSGNNYVRLNPFDLPAHILRVEYEQG
jgi:starch synthase (maltosyl-transferring)